MLFGGISDLKDEDVDSYHIQIAWDIKEFLQNETVFLKPWQRGLVMTGSLNHNTSMTFFLSSLSQ